MVIFVLYAGLRRSGTRTRCSTRSKSSYNRGIFGTPHLSSRNVPLFVSFIYFVFVPVLLQPDDMVTGKLSYLILLLYSFPVGYFLFLSCSFCSQFLTPAAPDPKSKRLRLRQSSADTRIKPTRVSGVAKAPAVVPPTVYLARQSLRLPMFPLFLLYVDTTYYICRWTP